MKKVRPVSVKYVEAQLSFWNDEAQFLTVIETYNQVKIIHSTGIAIIKDTHTWNCFNVRPAYDSHWKSFPDVIVCSVYRHIFPIQSQQNRFTIRFWISLTIHTYTLLWRPSIDCFSLSEPVGPALYRIIHTSKFSLCVTNWPSWYIYTLYIALNRKYWISLRISTYVSNSLHDARLCYWRRWKRQICFIKEKLNKKWMLPCIFISCFNDNAILKQVAPVDSVAEFIFNLFKPQRRASIGFPMNSVF